MTTNRVIAKTYQNLNGQTCLELLKLTRGKFAVAVNGQIQDARRKLTTTEAQEWYDGAAMQVGQRPK